LHHLCRVYGLHPRTILADVHPGYALTRFAGGMAAETGSKLLHIQHHEAHFAAVLAENGRLNHREPVLGIIWDGTGFGHDRQIWGGEVMVKDRNGFSRAAHLYGFPVIAGDKMNREPRLSALSLCREFREADAILRSKFSKAEWDYYRKSAETASRGGETGRQVLQTTSMGRFFDAVASLTGICDINTYEGEAAAMLEAAARSVMAPTGKDGTQEPIRPGYSCYPFTISDGIIGWQPAICTILADLEKGTTAPVIAARLIRSLARLVFDLSVATGIRCIALSGGVFQNALLTGLIEELKPSGTELLFHNQLSPNDENIGFGQLAHAAATGRVFNTTDSHLKSDIMKSRHEKT
jgi:hydrogenase maturation protein HypF